MLASWRMNMEVMSPTWLWLQLNKKSRDKKRAREAFSAMLMLDVSLEGIVQLFVLISLYFIPAVLPRVSGLGAEFEDTNPAWTTCPGYFSLDPQSSPSSSPSLQF